MDLRRRVLQANYIGIHRLDSPTGKTVSVAYVITTAAIFTLRLAILSNFLFWLLFDPKICRGIYNEYLKHKRNNQLCDFGISKGMGKNAVSIYVASGVEILIRN